MPAAVMRDLDPDAEQHFFLSFFLQLFSYKPTAGARSKLPKKLLVWYEYMYETDEEELRKPEIIFPV